MRLDELSHHCEHAAGQIKAGLAGDDRAALADGVGALVLVIGQASVEIARHLGELVQQMAMGVIDDLDDGELDDGELEGFDARR